MTAAADAVRELWRSDVPPGTSGDWAVERFEVADRPVDRDRLAALPGGLRYAWSAGRYTRLRRGRTVYMTDTADEWWSHRAPILEAARRGGRILVTGLGLGLVVDVMLRNPYARVERVMAIERSADVIRLVGPHLLARHGDRLRIVQADALEWRPPPDARFSVVWHDLWDRPEPERCPEVERLEAVYRDVADWQGSWPRHYLEAFAPRADAPSSEAATRRRPGTFGSDRLAV